MKIELKNITKKIKKNTVIDDINYTFTGGCIYGLAGKNGCGKTMLMRLIAGLIYPTEGKVYINDRMLGKDISFPDSIGILIENPEFLNDYTGYENLKMLAGLQKNVSDEDIKNTLESVGLDYNDKRKFYKYSLGMRQRLGIAAAIMGKPDIILLDEPINAIDEEGVAQIKELIRGLVEENRIIIIACHDKEEMDYLADKKLMMSAGKIVEEIII
ncbi:MAG: ATP-binding cassette domain-containing protein [Lachnospiraceae bacterium]|nr:ATP-binding cassette domain-containing protein [Lachnospiraceae bacterium]